MNRTPIEWTHRSANPFKMRMPDGTLINVCVHKSDGCRFCYAEGIVRRWWKKEWGEFPGYTAALLKLGTPVLVEDELLAVLRLSERIGTGKADPSINRVFWNDMTDEYLEFWPDEFIYRCWDTRYNAKNLIHQVLTKRPDRMLELVSQSAYLSNAPLANVWLGVSVEDQKTADERIPPLLQTPAAVRWISAEPLLGPVDLSSGNMIGGAECYCGDFVVGDHGPLGKDACRTCRCKAVRNPWKRDANRRIDWVVVGGESGPKARPFDLAWARSIVEQCKAADVPVFVKQLGAQPIEIIPPASSFKTAQTFSYEYADKKGGDITEWPADLRVREFPATTEARSCTATT